MASRLIIGCGYLGQRVAPLWIAQCSRHAPRDDGHHAERDDYIAQSPRVFATTRTAAHLPIGLEPIVCDVLNPASLRGLPEVETVLYAVGFDRASGASMHAVYVEGLANVLDHLPKPKRFIYISSSSVYHQSDGGWVDETAATEPSEESGRIVLEAESVLRKKCPEALILRFSGIYGRGRLLRRKTIEGGEPIVGDADKWLNLIHVEDGARAILAAEQLGHPGRIYNVCDDHPVRRRDFYTALARVLKAPEPKFAMPPPDQPTPPHEKGNRRIDNRRMKEELRVELMYPAYDQGLRGSV